MTGASTGESVDASNLPDSSVAACFSPSNTEFSNLPDNCRLVKRTDARTEPVVAVLYGETGEVNQIEKRLGNFLTDVFDVLEEPRKVVSLRIVFANQAQPRLESLLSRLLDVEAEGRPSARGFRVQ